MTADQVARILKLLYPSSPWPKPFGLLRAAAALAAGAKLGDVARECETTQSRVKRTIEASDVVAELFGTSVAAEKATKAARQMLGNLIIGRCAEITFVERYKREAATNELELSDVRESRSDTDYRLLNGRGRPVYRINIKYVGSVFRRAPELVGLESGDCFALATYKIVAALQKQEQDRLPFLFIVVSVPGLTAEEVGGKPPRDLLEFLALVTESHIQKKRDLQDRVVAFLEESLDPGFGEVLDRVQHGNWYVLSARRADMLLRQMLFDRVYALRVRGFAQVFRGAEVDMHFSLKRDLVSLDTYLHTLRASGYPMVTTMLERGEY